MVQDGAEETEGGGEEDGGVRGEESLVRRRRASGVVRERDRELSQRKTELDVLTSGFLGGRHRRCHMHARSDLMVETLGEKEKREPFDDVPLTNGPLYAKPF